MSARHRTRRSDLRAHTVADLGATVTPGRGMHRDRPARVDLFALLDEAFARTDTVRIRPVPA